MVVWMNLFEFDVSRGSSSLGYAYMLTLHKSHTLLTSLTASEWRSRIYVGIIMRGNLKKISVTVAFFLLQSDEPATTGA